MISPIKAIGAYKDIAQSSSKDRSYLTDRHQSQASEDKQNGRERQMKSSFDQILHKMMSQ